MRSDKLFCISYGDGGGLRDLARMRPDKLFLFFPLPARRGARSFGAVAFARPYVPSSLGTGPRLLCPWEGQRE